MGQERRAVNRLDLLRRGRDCFGRVAVLSRAVGRGCGQPLLEMLGNGRARLRCGRAFVPDDRQGIERPFRPPPGVGDDGDAAVLYLHHLAHAGHGGDLRLVVALELAAEHRALLDRGAQHARQLDVDGVDLAAVELVGGIKPFQRLARDLPILRILELDALGVRRRELGGRRSDLAVAHRPLGCSVGDHAVCHGELADRHRPGLRGGLQQHHARRGPAAADIILRGADAAAAAGSHLAPGALAGEVGAGGDLLGGHLAPIAFELLGDELGEAGERALAHLRARDADHAGVVGPDRHPDIDFRAGVAGALRDGFAEAGRQVETEREAAAGRGGADDERAARQLRGVAAGDLFHGLGSLRFWMCRWPPCARRLARADRCRSDRYWSSPGRCPGRSASGFS